MIWYLHFVMLLVNFVVFFCLMKYYAHGFREDKHNSYIAGWEVGVAKGVSYSEHIKNKRQVK